MAARRRLDAELVRRALAPSRTAALGLIERREVLVSGAIADKASRLTAPGEPIELLAGPPRYVSRGGEKLDAALAHFHIDVAGLRVLDAGASTGGFTDCCLQRGAAHVYSVDVGHGQLHERIRAHQRVTVVERYNVRTLELGIVEHDPIDVVVADLSFISLTMVIAPFLRVVRPGGRLVMLVKPQFEAGRRDVSKGSGVVSDPTIHAAVCERVQQHLEGLGATVDGWMQSPITGAEGNIEFLVAATAP